MTMSNRSGFTVIAVVFITIIVFIVAMTISTFLGGKSDTIANNQGSLRAFYVADGGFQYYMKQLSGDSDWSTPPTDGAFNFSGGSFTITTSAASKDEITVRSAASITEAGHTYTRTVQYVVKRTGAFGFASEYVLYWGGGVSGGTGTTIQNNSTVTGSIYTNSNLTLSNNVTVSGDTVSSGTIGGDTSGVTGAVTSNTPVPSDAPMLDTAPYKAEVNLAKNLVSGTAGNVTRTGVTYNAANNNTNTNRFMGNLTLSGATKMNNGARITVKGNLTINNTLTVTGLATIDVGGTVNINGATISDNLMIYSGGRITGGNNATVGGRCVLYSDNSSLITSSFNLLNNVTIGKNISGYGSSLITPGGVSSFGNNCRIYGMIYCGDLSINNNLVFYGNIMANHVSSIGNNAILTLSTGLVNLTQVTGLTSSGSLAPEVTGFGEVY